MLKLYIPDEESMLNFGAQLAQSIQQGCYIYLHGELGAGKTTLARGFLRGLGYKGSVKSPTYTLVEPYDLQSMMVYHLDLYRLSDPGELEYLGIRDTLEQNAVCLVEWPEQGAGMLPKADVIIHIEYLPEGRNIQLDPASPIGEKILINLEKLRLQKDLP